MLPKVTLVPLSVDHLAHVMTWVNEHEVMQYFANRQDDVSEAEERAYLERLVASPTDRAYSVFDEAGAYVGQCSVNQIYWPARNGRVFLVVRRERQGGGFGPAALAALIECAFVELGLHKLWLIVRRDNRVAQAMYLRAGFDFEGVLIDEYFVQGRYHDMVRMAVRRDPEPG
ncbi:MAG: GNAT family N-acetyltransferase [Deltaproteobacteria bacterium]|nr:GNAT family N-acetyltransferase [Deltaproteobacteria bacterium]